MLKRTGPFASQRKFGHIAGETLIDAFLVENI